MKRKGTKLLALSTAAILALGPDERSGIHGAQGHIPGRPGK